MPNGKTLITDPCYDYPENPNDQIADLFRLRGFTTDDMTACDYIILNHTHADHMTNLEELVNRFHPTVICHSGVAAEIAQVCDEMFLTDLYPVDYNGTYYLDGFRLAFVGGNDDGMAEHLRVIRPNIAFRNKITNGMEVEKVAGDWFGFMQESYSQYVVPMHFEVWENCNPGFSEQTFQRANEMAAQAGILCRMLSPKRTQWYRLAMGWEEA